LDFNSANNFSYGTAYTKQCSF